MLGRILIVGVSEEDWRIGGGLIMMIVVVIIISMASTISIANGAITRRPWLERGGDGCG